MPLTPDDVRNKRFQPVRLRREGYDMGEVDAFLDEVEAELERLLAENAELRRQAGVEADATVATAEPAEPADAATTSAEEATAKPAEESAVAPAGQPVGQPAAAPKVEQVKVTTAAEASAAATRLLELATRNADEVVAEAREQAQQIVSEAQATADGLDREARTRAENLDQETEQRRSEATSAIAAERARLDEEVEGLRAFEREYRSRLRSYFTQQLDALDGKGEGGELPAAHGHPQDGAGPDAEQQPDHQG